MSLLVSTGTHYSQKLKCVSLQESVDILVFATKNSCVTCFCPILLSNLYGTVHCSYPILCEKNGNPETVLCIGCHLPALSFSCPSWNDNSWTICSVTGHVWIEKYYLWIKFVRFWLGWRKFQCSKTLSNVISKAPCIYSKTFTNLIKFEISDHQFTYLPPGGNWYWLRTSFHGTAIVIIDHCHICKNWRSVVFSQLIIIIYNHRIYKILCSIPSQH
jgi:hypothetical protein